MADLRCSSLRALDECSFGPSALGAIIQGHRVRRYFTAVRSGYPIAATIATQIDPVASNEDALWAEFDRLTPIFLGRWQAMGGEVVIHLHAIVDAYTALDMIGHHQVARRRWRNLDGRLEPKPTGCSGEVAAQQRDRLLR